MDYQIPQNRTPRAAGRLLSLLAKDTQARHINNALDHRPAHRFHLTLFPGLAQVYPYLCQHCGPDSSYRSASVQ